ncbi:MAG: hypothetical protein MI674_07125 [Cytophagales bacterium]|nr:hypothetical protein [Cytophagales bacterium]
MITPKAIQQQASRAQVRDTQIEKDYVLSGVLYAISQQPILSQALAFKGGTVLKKAYLRIIATQKILILPYSMMN